MSFFAYRDGALHAEDVPLADIAAQVGTPFYCYSSAALTAQYRAFAGAFDGMDALVCFAVKANPNVAVIRTLAALGGGADVVSGGELRQALAAGVAPEKIVFSGVGKTDEEIMLALEAGVGQFNVESEPELEAIARCAAARGKRAPIALRVNPDVDADTHHKIATGRKEDKFGIDIDRAPELYRRAASMEGLEIAGLAVHIGSQLTRIEPFRDAFERTAALARALIGDGIPIRRLDLGGGLGIPYRNEHPPSATDYAAMVREAVDGLDCALVFEPGRFIAGNAGVLVCRVIYVKESAHKRFVIVDAAMNDLMRPALYDAWHDILPVTQPDPHAPQAEVEVVGPVCETGDVLGAGRVMKLPESGGLLAIMSSGAYGAAMASGYNSRLILPEIMVKGGEFAVVRERESYERMLARDRIPPWLEEPPRTRSRGAA